MFYIFHGSDTHAQKTALEQVLAKMGDPTMLSLNTARLTAPVSFSDLQQVSAQPFLAKYRVLIVENYFKSKPSKADLDQLGDFLPELPDFSRLFFLEEKALTPKNKFLKLAQESKKGYAKEFTPPQGRDIEKWLQKEAAARGGKIHPAAAQLLATNVAGMEDDYRRKGPSYQTAILAQEIEKLVLYKGEETIKTADVQLLSPYAAKVNIFDLVDAIGNRHGKRAAQLLQEKLVAGEEPFGIFAMIVRQFRLLIQVKSLADDGLRPPEISKKLKMHSFVAGKLYKQSQGFSLSQLETVYEHLLEIDVGMKTGQKDLVTSLHLFVAALTN